MEGLEFDESIFAEFATESAEHLATIEEELLKLEKEKENPDPELVNKVFRSIHTIKGSSGFLGLTHINELSHAMENVLSSIRSGKMQANSQTVDTLLGAADMLKVMIADYKSSNETDISGLVGRLLAIMNLQAPAGIKAQQNTILPLVDQNGQASGIAVDRFALDNRPAEHTYLYGLTFDLLALAAAKKKNIMDLLRILLKNGDILNGRLETPYEDLHAGLPKSPLHYIILYSTMLSPKKVALFPGLIKCQQLQLQAGSPAATQSAAASGDQTYTVVGEDGAAAGEVHYPKLGDILMEWGDMSRQDVDQVLGMQSKQRFGVLAVQAGFVSEEKIQAALVEQSHIKQTVEKERQAAVLDTSSTIRVPAGKVDALVNLIGELVTFQARLAQVSDKKNDPELRIMAKTGERLVASLRDNTMSIRMLPIGITFSRFTRMVRDLAKEIGKEIELTMSGSDTELDKTVIERLGDPLVHLIRNSVDHGIERPEVRVASGKPRQGTIHLAAEHAGANVLIRIADDGAGMDTGAIRAKAIEKGLTSATAELSDKEIFAFIFAPGFSTAKVVTNVSGRGVGMDVVKKNLDALRGSIEIESMKGKGSTITLKLPLTLAIIDGLLVKIGPDFFVIPLSVVERCVELSAADMKKAHGRHVLNVGGEFIPYIVLRDEFSCGGDPPPIQQVVIAGVDSRRVGVVVDHVIGEYQTVIKPLGTVYKSVDKISGATILGDGRVALILDVQRIAQTVEHEETERYRDLDERGSLIVAEGG